MRNRQSVLNRSSGVSTKGENCQGWHETWRPQSRSPQHAVATAAGPATSLAFTESPAGGSCGSALCESRHEQTAPPVQPCPPQQPHVPRSAAEQPAFALAWQQERIGAGRDLQCGQPDAGAAAWGCRPGLPRLPKSSRLRKSARAVTPLATPQRHVPIGKVPNGTSAAASQTNTLPTNVSNKRMDVRRRDEKGNRPRDLLNGQQAPSLS